MEIFPENGEAIFYFFLAVCDPLRSLLRMFCFRYSHLPLAFLLALLLSNRLVADSENPAPKNPASETSLLPTTTHSPAAPHSPAATHSTAVAHSTAATPENCFILRTADGLPVEAVFVSLSHDKIKVRLTSSGREIFLPFTMQNEAIRKKILTYAQDFRKGVTTLPFNITLAENSSTKKELRFPQMGLLGRAANAPIRVLFPGGRCLRVKSRSTAGVDIPVEMTIYWYAKMPNRGVWSMEFQEKITLNVNDDPEGEFLSTPPSFPRSAYQGFAVIATNPANNSILLKSASHNTFLEDMEVRRGLRKPVAEKPVKPVKTEPKWKM